MTVRMIGAHITRMSIAKAFDWAKNSSFAQVRPAFTLGMIIVGLSAQAALTTNPTVVAIALILSTFLRNTAALQAAIAIAISVPALAKHGANIDGIPTLMAVPGITLLRHNHARHTHFGTLTSPVDDLWLLAALLAMQLAFIGLGLTVTRKHSYFKRFVTGPDASARSYGPVSAGVGLAVVLQFRIRKGLVGAGLLAKFSSTNRALSGLALANQLAMIALVLILNRKRSSAQKAIAAPAE